MNLLFYVSAAVAIAATLMMVTRVKAVHALLYLIVSLLAVAMVFYLVGAPFVAALEVIIYAGAIMVLFVFVVMLLNLGPRAAETERSWLAPGMWVGPVVLAVILGAEIAYILFSGTAPSGAMTGVIGPQQVGMALYGPYLIGVELASMLLLAGLVGAYHLGREQRGKAETETHDVDTHDTWSDPGRDLVRVGDDRAVGAP
jgi:NADH-quinone oxidoreductase subunit J